MYNNALHIEETIESVRDQTISDWISIIVDNGSTDDTAEKMINIIAGDDRFHFYKKNNEGPSAGRNYGYKKLPSQIEYIHFLDGDDKLKPEFLEVMVSYMNSHEEVGLLGCQFDLVDECSNYIGPGYRSRFAPNSMGFPRSLRIDEKNTPFESFFSATGQGAFALFKKKVYDLTTGYEEAFWSHEDSDIFCQMALFADVHYLSDRLYIVRDKRNSLTGSPKADYSKFRDKWDFYFSEDDEVNSKIDNALKYYYGAHAPLRHFKISIKAGREFLKNGKMATLKWFLQCFTRGLMDLLLRKELKRRWKQRLSAAPHFED